jgi:asparagine synthase (glutamine-hydrolysing)
MCGISGFWTKSRAQGDNLAILRQMTDALAHRGPDGSGLWQDVTAEVNLGHRRLAIIDLSPAGHQPMVSADGNTVLSYNGEIYNFPELRAELASLGVQFRSSSDTEVLLHGLSRWGVDSCLRKLNGMFAFAYWEGTSRILWLARDRFGEKPLYYSWQSGRFFFGSELKALQRHPEFSAIIDIDVLPSYLRFNYVPSPHSIFRRVHKLPAGHLLKVEDPEHENQPQSYWKLSDLISQRVVDSRDATDEGLIGELDSLMARSVRQRMVSDVPLGAFLSGGVDSSLVVALMQKQSTRPIKTFTIGYWETDYNEAADAARVAKHLGTEHHEYYISSRECMDIIYRLPEIYDEPFADSSQIPTTLVSRFTQKHVKVVLSGDAGDEMFGGYNRYIWGSRIWPILARLPIRMRGVLQDMAHKLTPGQWNAIFGMLSPLLPPKLRVRGAGEKIHKFADAVGAKDSDALYASFVSQWKYPALIVPGASETPILDRFDNRCTGLNYVEKMMFLDQMTYLPSDILCKVDRASMSTGLESRVPFLDNDVVEFAWSLPIDVKMRHGIGKWATPAGFDALRAGRVVRTSKIWFQHTNWRVVEGPSPRLGRRFT